VVHIASNSISWNNARLEHLLAAVNIQAPAAPFGCPSKYFWQIAQQRLPLVPSEVVHLLVDHAGFILVVCFGRSSV